MRKRTMIKMALIRTRCPCGHDGFEIKGGGDCPECGKDLNNCLWPDDQTYYLEEQSMNDTSSVTVNGSPVLRVSVEPAGWCGMWGSWVRRGSWGSWAHYIDDWNTRPHPDPTRVVEMRRRFLLGLDIFTGKEIDEQYHNEYNLTVSSKR